MSVKVLIHVGGHGNVFEENYIKLNDKTVKFEVNLDLKKILSN